MILNFTKHFYINGRRKKTNFEDKIKKGIKLHTARHDKTNRWLINKKIDFATGAETSKYNCFKEGVCTSTQRLTIIDREVWIDGRGILPDEVEHFAINDGFDNIDDFWAWFDSYSPFRGKIIHWTDLIY